MPMYRKSMLVLLVLAAAVIGGIFYGLHAQEQAVPLDAAGEQQASPAASRAETAEVTVYVTGAVQKPGLVTVPEGTRIAAAVEACGGLLPTAASESINLAQVLKDGQQITVPERQQLAAQAVSGAASGATPGAAQAKAAAAGGAASSGLVNINTADEKLLDTLPGIGPAMAKRIIEYRETQGPFTAIEELKRVKGIGEAKFAKLKDKVCI